MDKIDPTRCEADNPMLRRRDTKRRSNSESLRRSSGCTLQDQPTSPYQSTCRSEQPERTTPGSTLSECVSRPKGPGLIQCRAVSTAGAAAALGANRLLAKTAKTTPCTVTEPSQIKGLHEQPCARGNLSLIHI